MSSTRQLKHHARFHAAVLRYLFPPSLPHSSTDQEAVDQSCEEVRFRAQPPKGAELFTEEKYSDHEDDKEEPGKASLSRAQRKRLKLKKLKEEQSDVVPAKKFIGPSLPDVLEKRRHEVLDCKSACALLQAHGTCPTLLHTEDGEDVNDVRENEFLSTAAEEEKHLHIAGELESLCTKTWEAKDGHDGVEPEPVSKAKRRRLAKKKKSGQLTKVPTTRFLVYSRNYRRRYCHQTDGVRCAWLAAKSTILMDFLMLNSLNEVLGPSDFSWLYPTAGKESVVSRVFSSLLIIMRKCLTA